MHRGGAAFSVSMLVVAIAASACGGSSSGGNPSNGSTASTGPSGQVSGLVQEDINPQPVSNLKQGGTLTYSLDEFATNWNYNEVDGTESSINSVQLAVMPQPFISDEKGNVSANPDYITSATETNTNPQTIELKLNPDAKWSDGSPITEKDYATQWQALNGKNKAYQVSSSTGYSQIKSVSEGSGGQFDVVVVFSKPFVDWKALFTPLYPAKYQSSPKLFNTGYVNAFPLTGGPFGNVTFNKSAQTVTVTPSSNWWGDKPLLSKIVYRALTSDAANQAFVNGELNYDFDVAVDTADYDTVKKAKDGDVTLAVGPDYRQITVSSKHGFMSDEKVRQAVEMGINRDTLIKSDLNGIPWPVVPLDNHFFMNVQTGYQDNTGDLGTYNPTGAEQLLQSDGFTKDSNGYYAKGGKEINLDFMIPAGIQSSKNEGELTQAMLKQVGIKVHINSVPVNDWSDKYLVPGNFDLAPFSWLGTPFPISSSVSIYSSPKNGGGQNFTGTSNPTVDKLLKQAITETDPTQAISVTNEADKDLWQEVHTITLFERPQMCGVTKGLANIGSFGFATPDFTKIGWMKGQPNG
ncbi:MAG TPA: ABC transporter family substrate-binding protein [Mycobacteriales bacterium]|nr:ABC transporter family substrate-binding protein [Mycobacteriales bacterium]HWA66442.1 ABC transporter family substrate-binding protein [Mycobacteriales bacterium]